LTPGACGPTGRLTNAKAEEISIVNVLLIGAGGREHALAWKISASPLLGRLYAAPGNPGIAQHAECVALDVADHQAVVAFAREKEIDLVVVGPEAPLVAGLADDLAAAGIPVFGPSAKAAQLEGSKGFTKDLCAR
jgi:phosphoribosylamine--glycine ligase